MAARGPNFPGMADLPPLPRRRVIAGLGLAGLGAGFIAACASTRADPAAAVTAAKTHPPLGRIVQTSLGATHGLDQGRGDGPPVVLIHGASGNLRDWSFAIAPRLAERRRVISFDRPGFGYSERRTEDGWRPELQARQLREATAAFGAEKPVIVGHSWGAAVALAWALEAPEAVSGVVAVSGVTMPWGGLVPTLDAIGFGSLVAGLYTRRLTRTAETGGVERFIQRAFRPQAPPDGYLDYVGAPLALRQETLEANAADLANTNPAVARLAEGYGDLRVPVELMHGDADWLLDIEQHGQGAAAALANARLTPLPGVGHMAHHARPDVLEGLLDRFA